MLLLLFACSTPPPAAEPVAPGPPLFGHVPRYPGATKLCETRRALADRDLTIVKHVSADDPAKVIAFYEASHSGAVTRGSGARLLLRGDAATGPAVFAVVSPADQADYDCGGAPGPSAETAIVVTTVALR